MAEPATELTLDSASLLAAEEHEVAIVGRSPWYLAWRRLRRNWVALFALLVFFVIVLSCALAPVYAHQVAHTGPNDVHAGETVIVSGKPMPVIGGGSYYDAEDQQVHRRGSRPTSARPGGTRTAASCSAPTTSAATSPSGCSTAGATR